MLRACLAIVLIALLIKITAHMQFNNKVILSLGKISYEVYLSHGIIIEVMSLLGSKLKPGLYILSVIIVTVLLSYLVNLVTRGIIKSIRENIT